MSGQARNGGANCHMCCAHRSFMSCAVRNLTLIMCPVQLNRGVRASFASTGHKVSCLGVYVQVCTMSSVFACITSLSSFVLFTDRLRRFLRIHFVQVQMKTSQILCGVGQIVACWPVILLLIHPRPNCPVAVLLSGMTRWMRKTRQQHFFEVPPGMPCFKRVQPALILPSQVRCTPISGF